MSPYFSWPNINPFCRAPAITAAVAAPPTVNQLAEKDAGKQWVGVGACVATVVAVLGLTSWPDLGRRQRATGARVDDRVAILFGFVAALALRPLAGLPAARRPINVAEVVEVNEEYEPDTGR